MSLDLDNVAEGINNCLALLEHWSRVDNPDSPVLAELMNQVVSHAGAYVAAVDTSVKIAQIGCVLADAAISLSDLRRTSPESVVPSQLKEYMGMMSEKATRGYNYSVEVRDTFQKVYTVISEISTRSSIDDGRPVYMQLPETHPTARNAKDILPLVTAHEVVRLVEWWNDVQVNLGNSDMFLTSGSFCDVSFCEQWVLVKSRFLQYQLRVNVIKDFHSRLIGAIDGGPVSMSDDPPSDTSASTNSRPRLSRLRVTINHGLRYPSLLSPKPSQRSGSNTPSHDFASAAFSAFSDHIFRLSHGSPSTLESPVKHVPSTPRAPLGNSRTAIVGFS